MGQINVSAGLIRSELLCRPIGILHTSPCRRELGRLRLGAQELNRGKKSCHFATRQKKMLRGKKKKDGNLHNSIWQIRLVIVSKGWVQTDLISPDPARVDSHLGTLARVRRCQNPRWRGQKVAHVLYILKTACYQPGVQNHNDESHYAYHVVTKITHLAHTRASGWHLWLTLQAGSVRERQGAVPDHISDSPCTHYLYGHPTAWVSLKLSHCSVPLPRIVFASGVSIFLHWRTITSWKRLILPTCFSICISKQKSLKRSRKQTAPCSDQA